MPRALENVRVIDFSNRLSGAWAARIFGDFGAEVILVESDEGHEMRREPPFHGDESLMHAYVNSNKKSVRKRDADIPELIHSAEVIVTTDVPLPSFANSIEADQIHLSITPHGLTGPLGEVPGNNLTSCARVGWSTINGCEGEPPLQLPHNQTGYIAGIAAFVGGIAALYRRKKTSQGERVDVSEIEALSNTCAPWAQVGNFIGGQNRMARGPNGPRTRTRAGPLWQAKNGAINFGYGDWQQWTSALHFLGLPEVAENPDFISAFGRHQKDTRPVRDGLASVMATRDKWEVFHGLAERRCISGVVQNAKEIAENEHLEDRGFFVDTKVGDQAFKAPGEFGKLSATPLSYDLPAPELGEHSDSIQPRQRVSTSADSTFRLPLHGIRVLAFTGAWSGTQATQLLGLLGADVVQVESRRRPDVWRGAGAPVPPAIRNPDIEQNPLNNNGMYNTVNHNKRAITLDVQQPEGKEIFWELVPKFDIICDNFSPHVMTNWGVTMETLREKRSDIILASLSGYGRTGRLAEYPANGATTEPMAGLSSIHGYEGDLAQNTGGLIPDPISGTYFAGTILAALYHREQTGEGQRIDLSMYESVAVQIGDAVLDYTANGFIRKPSGNKHPRFAPHGTYPTEDGEWISIAAESDEAFSQLSRAVNLDDTRFASLAERKANEDALNGIIEEWTASLTLDELQDRLKGTKVIHSPVFEFLSIYKNPSEQYREREFTIPITHPESGTHYMPLNPWVLANTSRGSIRYSPCFGEHSKEVLQQELGISDEEYDKLEAKGITGTTRISR